MKLYRNEKRTVFRDQVASNGQVVAVPETETVSVPRKPVNLRAALTRVLLLAAVLTSVAAVVWGAVAIGSLIGTYGPHWAAYAVAGVFDLLWVACVIGRYLDRFDPEAVEVWDKFGLAALAVSVGANVTDGVTHHHVAAGIVGALAPVAAKAFWAAFFFATRVRLSPADRVMVAQRRSAIGTMTALAADELDALFQEDQAARARLYLEHRRGQRLTASHGPSQAIETRLTAVDLRNETLRDADETLTETSHVSLRDGETPRSETSHVVSQALHADTVAILDRLKVGERLTATQAAELIGKAKATGGRRLKEAQAAYTAWQDQQNSRSYL